MAAPLLLGPPVIRGARPSPAAATAEAPASHPFLDLLDTGFNAPPPDAAADAKPRMARTENNSATYACSGNPCLDFFFQVVPDTTAQRVQELLAAAWARDPLTALKLVCNLRGVRGTGKSDREGFYAAALWVHAHHPRTLACNVPALAEFGYLKDFPELLYRLVHGADARKHAKAKADTEKMRRRVKSIRLQALAGRKRARAGVHGAAPPPAPVAVPTKPLLADFVNAAVLSTKSERSSKPGAMATTESHDQATMEVAVEPKHEGETEATELDQSSGKSMEKKKKGVPSSKKVRKLAPGGKRRKIGLAAKWCPTPGSSFDRTTLLCEAVARQLFPRDSNPDYADLSEEHYAYRVLHRLRREVLVPLRKVLELPEVYMSAQRWSELPYTRVASVAMRRYKALFKKHDEARFGKYLEDVEAGKAKIAAGALLPHEIAAAAYRGEDDNVSELQWSRMVEDLRKKGSLSNCIAVCDVSGSMGGLPMEVCIALGLLISELSEQPWAGRAITFSSRPQIHTIVGKTLQQKLSFVRYMDWGGNTNFQAVFDRILQTAVDARLAPEKMIRTLFVFSDMEFDMASANPWETDYRAICRKFRNAGYGDVVPQIVFWNLRDSRSTPVTSTQPGVAMVSGFSKNLVKLFLENDGVVSPEAVMAAAIAGEEYQKLSVFD
ncbi:hypothetical protein SETIT_1G159000v2 [Setaria italica]|uniref:TROVE domain-containing protein n=2 Tax=Setaria TaxID=4554 RepID=A0A368PLB3_SETIT|nr:uncharacterized protein LOC101784630 [Setaria italica]RCV06393.1 hypothetical protein SETIT_1G159000v2 [Setaria italica]TKW39155.1 hypothetical protein SEVIR_1G160000v2 [Setaria viridis]